MPYVVKSSLEIESTIVPWNERETQKLVKEKTEFLEKKEKEKVFSKEEETEKNTPVFKNTKKNQKAGEK